MKKGQAYLCESCGVRVARWQGSCHACGAWDSLVLRPLEATTAVRERGGVGGLLKGKARLPPQRRFAPWEKRRQPWSE